jgi:hypothetical protein
LRYFRGASVLGRRDLSMKRIILILMSLGLASTGGAAEQQVLVPLVFGDGKVVSGAYGTQWIGEVWAANDSGIDIQTLQWQLCEFGCPPPQLPAGSQRALGIYLSESVDAGALLYVPEEIATEVFFSARVLEITRGSQPAGFAVPVVRENEYFHSPVTFPGVPFHAELRSSLRIYDPSGRGGRQFAVEFVDSSGDVVNSFVMTLAEGRGHETNIPIVAGFGAVHDLTSFAGGTLSDGHFSVRVRPLGEPGPYWAFISVTDNVTQQALVITAD